MKPYFQALVFLMMASCTISHQSTEAELIKKAKFNAEAANEAFSRSDRFVNGWLQVADSTTGLIPRNLRGDNYWNPQDAAADNYPFMVITSYFTNRELYYGRMLEMLETERQLTSCLGACPGTFDFRTQTLRNTPIDTGNVIFGSAEYMKDGLLPITELLGKTPWSERMLSILDDLSNLVHVVTEIKGEYFGNSQVIEVNGDLLQILSRVYWMTGDTKYLNWAVDIADSYLLSDRNPADFDRLRLRDHGCEFILGLCEIYATVHFAMPEKQEQYRAPLHYLLDRILKVGRNTHGLFYDEINPKTGEILVSTLSDTWGYTLDGYYTVYELDGIQAYKDAIYQIFNNLNSYYRNYDWEGRDGMDGYADAIESALNLYNRERSEEAASWIDSEIQVMFSFQQENGIIQGWHGDGNFARTAIMYALWKTMGTYVYPWRNDVKVGAVEVGNGILISLSAEKEWKGTLHFDIRRSHKNLHLPMDWARINQFPEWFTVGDEEEYSVSIDRMAKKMKGTELISGLELSLAPGQWVTIRVDGSARHCP